MSGDKKEIQLFKNDALGLQMKSILNEDGSISVNLQDAAIGLGFTRVANSGNVVVRWERVNQYLREFGACPQVGTEDLGFSQDVAKDDFIPESLYYLLAMKASNSRAQKFQKWLALEVIPEIRKTGSYNPQPEPTEEPTIDVGMYLEAARILSQVPDSRRYIINCLRYVIPDIDLYETAKPEDIQVDVATPPTEPAASKSLGPYSKPFNRKMFSNYLAEHKIKYTDLELQLGTSEGRVSKWCKGVCSPTEFYRIKICELLDLPIGYFDNRKRTRAIR